MSKQLANIHDGFFKQALGNPMLAGTFLREHLPPEVADLLGPEAPEPVPGSFVDEELRQHHSDLLFRIHLKGRREGYAYVLLEHKSSPDPGARLQLLRYVIRVLLHEFERNDQQLPLPAVVPLLVHQGPEDWAVSCEFADLFGAVPEGLRAYLPSFRHALVDLGRMDDGALSAEARLRAYLKALKYCRRPELPDCFDVVLAEAPVIEDEDLFVILTYLDKGPIAFTNQAMHDALERIVPERKEKIVGWFTQPYYDKGKAEGLAEGEALGEAKGRALGEATGAAKGKATMLARLLEKRFGSVPTDIRRRIFSADAGCIEAWIERFLDAPDLRSIFDGN